jgi:ArsR family transcriptional regulator
LPRLAACNPHLTGKVRLAILRRHNLLKTRRQGNYVFYAIQDPAIFTVLDAALVVFNNHLVNVQDTFKNLEDE